MDMKNFYLNSETGDIEFDAQNNIKMVEGRDDEKQSVRLLLKTNTEEWFLNVLHGLAYKHLQVKNPSETRVRAEMLKAIQQEERVEEVMDFKVDFERPNRKLTISFRARLASGEVLEDEVTI